MNTNIHKHIIELFKRILFSSVLCLLCMPLSLAAQSDHTVYLTKDIRSVVVGKNVQYLIDSNGACDFDDIRSGKYDNDFKESKNTILNFGFSSKVYWLRLTVSNKNSSTTNWMLEVGYPHHDHITAYIPDSKNRYEVRVAGDHLPFNKREVKYRNFIFRLTVPQGTVKTIYVRFKTSSSVQIPLTIWEPLRFSEKVNYEQFFFGIYYGIMWVMMIYNLILFIGVRDRAYLFYVLYISTYSHGQMALNGLHFEFLWPQFPLFANQSVLVSLFLGLIFLTEFCRVYLQTGKHLKVLDKVLIGIMAYGVLGIAVSFLTGYATGVKMVALMGILIPIPALAAGIISWYRGVPAARYYVIAWVLFLVGIMTLAVRNFGLLPNVFFTEYAVQIGSGLEAVLLSLGLASRINAMKRERYDAQQKALIYHKQALEARENLVEQLREMDRMKDRMTRKLEKEVQDRTNELRSALEEVESVNQQLRITSSELWGEMQLAKKIQTILLPHEPGLPGFSAAVYTMPAAEVGGDYYDFINSESRDWVIIGDVSGHGVPAGLIMMMVQSIVQSVVREEPGIEPSRLMNIINRTLTYNIHKLEEDKFMSMTALRIDRDGSIVHSGLHMDILVYRSDTGEIERIKTGGMWLGITRNIEVHSVDLELKVENNDVMLLFTDGIIEARNEDGKLYEMKKLIDTFRSCAVLSVDEIRDHLLRSLHNYEADDDVTFVVLKRL